MAKLNEVAKEIVKERGAPYLERLRRIDKGRPNWNVCSVCGEWVQGTCQACQREGKLVVHLGVDAFKDL